MASVSKGLLFSIFVRVVWAEVLELRHVKPLTSVPPGFLADVMEDYNCWGGDLAEIVIHADQAHDERPKDIVVATCRAACLSNIGCQAWSLNHGSKGGRGSGHCWLKHSCENGDNDPYSVSGLVDHKSLVQHVQAPETVDPAELVGVLDDTNCWGRDLAEVAIKSNGNTTRDELIVACKDACVADRACAAWTLNNGRTGIEGQGHCWLKSSCSGRMYDTRAEAGTVTHNPSKTTDAGGGAANSTQGRASGNTKGGTSSGVTDTEQGDASSNGKSTTSSSAADSTQGGASGNAKGSTSSGASDAAKRGVNGSIKNSTGSGAGESSVQESASGSAKSGTRSGAADGAQGVPHVEGASTTIHDSPRSTAGSNASDANSSHGGDGNTSGTSSSTGNTSSNAEASHDKGNPGNGNGSKSRQTHNKLSEMRFLQHGDLAASAPQLPALRGGDGNHAGLSDKDKGIIGGVVGASTGALAVGLLAGLLHPTSPQPNRVLDQLSPTPVVAVAGGNIKGPAGGNTAGIFAVAAVNDSNETIIEEEEESPVKRWWGWIFLIPLFLMAALCCFAIFMFKGNAAGSWAKRIKRTRAYSRVGSETSTDTAEGMTSSDSFSPRSPLNMVLRNNQQVYNSPTPAPRAFFRSPVNPQSRQISVALTHSPNAHLRQLSPVPMAQAGVMVMVPTSPQRLTSQQLQQQQRQQQGGQMSTVTSQQQTQVQSQQSGNNNSLFDALDQNQDGVITRSEFNRAFGVSPLVLNSAANTAVSAVVSTSPKAMVQSPSGAPVMVTTPSKHQIISEASSPVLHSSPSAMLQASPSVGRLSHSASSVQAVMGSPVLMAASSGAPLEAASVSASPHVEDCS